MSTGTPKRNPVQRALDLLEGNGADEEFATWHFLEFGYRPTPGMIGVDSHRSAFEAGRRYERKRAIKLLDDLKARFK